MQGADSVMHVPTLAELVDKHLAKVVEWGGTQKKPVPKFIQASPEGQQMIYDAMAHNARIPNRKN